MGKWGGGIFESDLDIEAIVDISKKAGIKLYSSVAPGGRLPRAAKFPERVRAHLDGGVFTRTFDFYKVTEVQEIEVEGNYYCVLLSVCAMMVGARFSDEQLKYLEDQYQICGLMKEGIWQVGNMLAKYKSGTPLLPEEPNRDEENAARDAGNKNRAVPMQNHFGDRYFADGPRKDFTEAMRDMVQGKQSNPGTPRCEKCHKNEEQIGKRLRHCAKCKTTLYCSRECQRHHWKLHKKDCTLNAAKLAEEKQEAGTGTKNGDVAQDRAEEGQGVPQDGGCLYTGHGLADAGGFYISSRMSADLPDDFGMA